MPVIETPYLLFLGDVPDQLAAKTAQGVVHWRPESCVGQLRLPGCKADVGLPELSIEAGAAAGARTLLVGVANAGGVLPPHWVANIVEAIEAGMDVASGLHMRLGDVPEIAAAAGRKGARLHDVRHPTRTFATGKGTKRSGKRLLAVGTDCSCGKMYTTLALEREMRERGMQADFRATGQTGILITGEGVSIDAVVADFISGAVEWLCPANDPDHWDLVEGQGSLFHPSFAGVSLGLLHGAQPDLLVLCHEPTRTHMRGLPHQKLPGLKECLERNLEAARLTNPDVQALGVSINTAALNEAAARDYMAEVEQQLGLPTVDAFRTGVARLVDAIP
ncbi:MAG: N-acetyltransferase DgcN [Geminicoccaceae bacterium]